MFGDDWRDTPQVPALPICQASGRLFLQSRVPEAALEGAPGLVQAAGTAEGGAARACSAAQPAAEEETLDALRANGGAKRFIAEASLFERSGRLSEAARKFRRAIKLKPSFPIDAYAYDGLGNVLSRARNVQSSEFRVYSSQLKANRLR